MISSEAQNQRFTVSNVIHFSFIFKFPNLFEMVSFFFVFLLAHEWQYIFDWPKLCFIVKKRTNDSIHTVASQ